MRPGGLLPISEAWGANWFVIRAVFKTPTRRTLLKEVSPVGFTAHRMTGVHAIFLQKASASQ